MLFDVHVHTQEYSKDSLMPVAKVLKAAKEFGLSGICITDHGSFGFKREAEKLSMDSGLAVIVGMEYSCMEGDVLVFGAPGLADVPSLTLEEVILEVKREEGVLIAAHPFRWDTPLMPAAVRRFHDLLDGIEAFNGGATAEENLTAYEFAKEHEITMFGGSDSHHLGRLGRFATDIVSSVHNEDDFISAIKKSRSGKKGLESIFPVARKGVHYTPAFSNEKLYADRYSPSHVNSLQDIFNLTKK